MNQRFASIISKITEPMIMMSIMVFFGALHANLQGLGLFLFILYILSVSAIVGFARLRFMKSLHTNWDVSERPKRVRLLLLLLGFGILLFLSVTLWHNVNLIKLGTGLMLWLLGFLLITLRTKISGHMGVLTLTIGYLTLWFGYAFGFLFLLLPLVGWARLKLKRHTMIEVIGGTVYSSVALILFAACSLW